MTATIVQHPHNLATYDVLDCPACEQPVPPSKITAGPCADYRCQCGRSWKIDPEGNEVSVRRRLP